MSLKMDKTNEERLRILIDFLRNDIAPDMGNMEKAAAEFLSNHFSAVVSAAKRMDENDAE